LVKFRPLVDIGSAETCVIINTYDIQVSTGLQPVPAKNLITYQCSIVEHASWSPSFLVAKTLKVDSCQETHQETELTHINGGLKSSIIIL
jgi:hypothetical protein